MKTASAITGCLLIAFVMFCGRPASGDPSIDILPMPSFPKGAAGCDASHEKLWEKYRDELPTSDVMRIRSIIIPDLTKMHKRCDPKTRFSASVAQLLIRANFRLDELGGAQEIVRGANRLNGRGGLKR